VSKRWRDLPRRLPTSYDLAVDDLLPPRYHRLKHLNAEAKAAYEAEKNLHKLNDIYAIKARHERWMAKIGPLTAILERYERRAMRRYVRQVNSFLLAPKDVRQRRPVQKLRLQMLGKWHEDIDGWVTAAIGKWGVEDFELVVDGRCLSYNLKRLDRYRNLPLKQLALSNCQPVCSWNCLTVQRLTKLSLTEGSYMGMLSTILLKCVQLRDFKITSCSYFQHPLRFNVPTSKISSLQVDRCSFVKIYLVSLPCLETFVCRGRPTKLSYGEVPQLKHVSLDYLQTEDNDIDDESGTKRTYPPSKFFKRIPQLDHLVLQFKGTQVSNHLLYSTKSCINTLPCKKTLYICVCRCGSNHLLFLVSSVNSRSCSLQMSRRIGMYYGFSYCSMQHQPWSHYMFMYVISWPLNLLMKTHVRLSVVK
jgi:hypothetical protein